MGDIVQWEGSYRAISFFKLPIYIHYAALFLELNEGVSGRLLEIQVVYIAIRKSLCLGLMVFTIEPISKM
jgi:hypothetical protein